MGRGYMDSLNAIASSLNIRGLLNVIYFLLTSMILLSFTFLIFESPRASPDPFFPSIISF